jgi:hypothetical protein
MANERFLSLPQNRTTVENISMQVLAEVEPDELEIATRFIGPLIDLAARDEVVVRDPAHQPSGFGNADLIASVIVPIIVSALGNLLQKLAGTGIDKKKLESETKEKLDELIKTEVEKATEEMLRRTRSSKARRKSKALKRATILEIERNFQIIKTMGIAFGDMDIAFGDQVNIIRFSDGSVSLPGDPTTPPKPPKK